VKDLEVLLLALPAVAAFGFTVYLRNVHEGKSEDHALTRSLTYSILATGFFVLVYIIKFTPISN
jgi:hypothetical protein